MMWFLLLLLHTAHNELVASEDKVILRNKTSNICEGHVEIYHKETWGYVGDADWSKNTEKVVCESTHCGEPVASSTKDILEPLENSTIWLNELKCKGNERSLWECDGPGWNASIYQKLTVKKVTCSSKITISLDRSKCAGAVRYSDGKTSGYFCSSTWGQKESGILCENLGCGGARNNPLPEWMYSENFRSSETKMNFNCLDFQKPDNLWQCVTGKYDGDLCKPVSVICEGYQRLQLTGNQSNVCSGQLEKEENGEWVPVTQNSSSFDVCQQMHCGTNLSIIGTNDSVQVTCSDKVKVVLGSGSENKCYGTVNIDVNGSVKAVCGSSWGKEEAELVCKELKCGKLIYFTKVKPKLNGVMDHVKCNGSESSLWHCQAQHEQNIKCSFQPKVVCSDSVTVKLVDGPGKCAGRLEITLEGEPKRVNKESWTDAQSVAVCKQLNCGDTGKTEKFSQGSSNFLSINCEGKNIKNISECIKNTSNGQSLAQEAQAVGITCEAHKVVFLNGTEACSGHVAIQHGSKTYWLSGSKVTWNQASADTVCWQMHCGNATEFSSPVANESVWNDSPSCSSRKESLFDCKTTTKPSDHQKSIAYVNCSGKIEMNLMNGCWGKVKVYTETVQGAMCADTWTEENSKMLCTYLDCGEAIKTHKGLSNADIRFSSLHATLIENGKLTQWNFVRNQGSDQSCNQGAVSVVCSGSVKPRFSRSSEHCSGNIEVAYEGKWIPVCSDALKDTKTQNNICHVLKCGDAVKRLSYFGPAPGGNLAISKITCSDTSLPACSAATSQSGCDYSGLQCADWKTMVPVGNKACSGTVLVHSGKGISAVSKEGWTNTEQNRLCQDMNCGKYKSTDKTQDQGIEINSFWNKRFNCTSSNIWECEKKTPPSKNNPLFINCQGEPSVTLSQGCHGEVRIDNVPVCGHNWDQSIAHKVCQEKHCGNSITSINISHASRDAFHVSCDKYHSILGQCRRIKGKCDKSVSISCSDSVKLRTAGKNGYELVVPHQDKWEKVCLNFIVSKEMENRICNETDKENYTNSGITTQGNLEMMLECAEGVKDIKRCVKQGSCETFLRSQPLCVTEIAIPPPEKPTTPIAPIIVGVALLLLVVILIVLFIRFCVRRARKSSRMLSTNDMEFESGEYEDVMNKENEMEDFSPGRFRSEDEFITENDGHSASSLPYDDIDEADEARPLTSPGTAAPADRDVSMHEDGVTYEVEDPQESYDDIDTIPQTTQTKVEVHDSPQTTHDANPGAAPPGLAQRDEDYLEPDQDG